MFLVNSRLGLFTAATSLWLPFSRSYGVGLPSSLTRVLPFVVEFSSHLPVSVCGTGTFYLFSGFSRQRGFINFATTFTPRQRYGFQQAYFTTRHHFALLTDLHSRDLTILLCHRFIYSISGGIGFSTDCPSSTPFGLDLGPDLPWADEPSPGNLGFSVAQILTVLSLLIPAFSLVYSPPLLSV